jgi:hypothetical protein
MLSLFARAAHALRTLLSSRQVQTCSVVLRYYSAVYCKFFTQTRVRTEVIFSLVVVRFSFAPCSSTKCLFKSNCPQRAPISSYLGHSGSLGSMGALGLMGSWAHWLLGSWDHGFLGSWAHWAHRHLRLMHKMTSF